MTKTAPASLSALADPRPMEETEPHSLGRSSLVDLRHERPTLSLPRAGRYFSLSRAKSYELNAQGRFPCPVLQIGERFHVRTADLAAALGIDPAALLVEV